MSLPLSDAFESIVLQKTPLIDVRAPIEFRKGAFVNAVNLPIMHDNERHLIGIRYKERGNEAAVALGKELIDGEPREQRVREWKEFIAQNPDTLLYCFRGGQRSKISQMWLEEEGISITRLKGGYKAFRSFLMERSLEITAQSKTLILGGRTGSGKTILLRDFQNSIDLEALANHRGSSFGREVDAQPSQVDFENALAYALIEFDAKKQSSLIIEHESHNIGKNFIPKPLYENLMQGELVLLERDLEERVEITYEEYITEALKKYEKKFAEEGLKIWAEDILAALTKIKKRLGSERYLSFYKLFERAFSLHQTKEAEALYREWIQRLLQEYYDPMYDYQIEQTKLKIVFRGNLNEVRRFLVG